MTQPNKHTVVNADIVSATSNSNTSVSSTSAAPPTWLPLAHDLITRLRLHHAGQSSKIKAAYKKGAFDADIAEDPSLADTFALFHGDYADTETDIFEAAPVPSRQLLTAIRLAATFGTEATLAAAQDWRSVAMLMDVDSGDMDLVTDVLKFCFPRQSWSLQSPNTTEGVVTKYHAQKFWNAVDETMDGYAPVLVIVPAGLAMPQHLRHAGLPVYRLPAITADLIIAHLRAGALGDALGDEAAFRAALPEGGLLAGLGTAQACAALRAPDLDGVVQRLAAMTKADETQGPTLDDMTADSPAVLAARRLIADLSLWKQGKVAWSDLSRSILFYGPPGTGKTYLARAMGNSAGIACVTGSFAEWQAAGHLGDMLREMRTTFAEARRLAPAILFIDEIDAVGSRESGDRHNSSYRTQVINGFLGEMNAIALEEGVVVVGACNHIDRIDPAVMRAGRFDIKAAVPMPDARQILGLMRRLLEDEIPEAELASLSRAAVGHSPAAIDAAIRAARSDARHTGAPITTASIRVHLSLSTDTDPRILWRVALHEAGHATVAAALNLGQITRLAITPYGGETHRQRANNECLLSDLEDDICYDLAGRAAERLALGAISAGAGGPAHSDLAGATDKALKIETAYGLGPDGPVWVDAPAVIVLQNTNLRGRVRKRLDQAESRAVQILSKHRSTLEALATALMAERSLNAEQIAEIVEGIGVPGGTTDSKACTDSHHNPKDDARYPSVP
ncbi:MULTISPECIES: AAA family ATPase [unclassified Yoonia]|uniref:AAA family ATPase n=1 Tax=unclassified Yoonia TaxID=2629118 RepID=UPI002AFE1915|nr:MULTISPECIES: AAA family ATPase [unclassified Yoonia]